MLPTSQDDPRATRRVESVIRRLAPISSRLPAFPGSVLLSVGLNLAFGDGLPPDLEPLRGKIFALCASDAGFTFEFEVTATGFVALRRSGPPAVTISASLGDFLQLARRRVDPDTLFFARRLVIEGDTELGLLLKNRLDALEFSALFARPPRPRDLLQGLRTALRGAFRSRSAD